MKRALASKLLIFRRLCPATLTLLLAVSCQSGLRAQTPNTGLQLNSLRPGGIRSFLSDSWGEIDFALSNPTDQDKDARLLTYFAPAPGRQYGRELWLPAQSTLRSWFSLGPPPASVNRSPVELKSLLYDRSGGQELLVRSPTGQPLHSDLARFVRREFGTTGMLDADLADGTQTQQSPAEINKAGEIHDLVRVLRGYLRVSPSVSWMERRNLPPDLAALDGVDLFVLGSDRIAKDVVGRQNMREWLRLGGCLWVLLDQVSPETVTALLGNQLNLQVVDRTSLTTIRVRGGPANPHRADAEPRELEDPVDFVRVLVSGQKVLYAVDGWPAAFVMEFGRGRILFTTLGARGWMRPRNPRDPKAPYREFPQLPVGTIPFEFLATELGPVQDRPLLTAEDMRAYVIDQIGYTVLGRNLMLAVFSALFVILTAAAVLLARKHLLEHLGWLGPSLALVAAGGLVSLGNQVRGSIPSTVAAFQVADATPGLAEVQLSGFLAAYEPHPEITSPGAERGGQFQFDVADLEGRIQRRIQTDLERWHWENLELPAGVRTAPFTCTERTESPLEAVLHFGPGGVAGRVNVGPFRELEDAIVSTPGLNALGLRLSADGTFSAAAQEEMIGGQMIAGSLLDDRQRLHQKFYEKVLAEPQPRFISGRSFFMAWSAPVDMHFSIVRGARTLGSALLIIPMRFEQTLPNTQVVVPAGFVESRRISGDGRVLPLVTESRQTMNMRLRFTVPPSVTPLRVEAAQLTIKMFAPDRIIELTGFAEGQPVPLTRLGGPNGIEKIDISDARLLKPDEQGNIYLEVSVGAAPGKAQPNAWRMEQAGLTLRGQTLDGKDLGAAVR